MLSSSPYFFLTVPPSPILVTQTQPTTIEQTYMWCSPQIQEASWMSLGIMVTHLVCIAQNWHLQGDWSDSICQPPAVPGPCTLGSTNHALHMPVLSHRPGVQRATYGWGAQYSSGTGISQREPPSPASTYGASSTPLYKILCWDLCPPVGLMWPSSTPYDVKGPTSAAILANIWVGKDPSNLPGASNCLLLSKSPSKGGTLPEGKPSWEPLLWPALGVIFILGI